jgi:deoxyadenosine/deoxycytidine kinase
MSKNRYLAVAGNIGSGKSTLVQFLSNQYGFRAFYEPNDENPYLADFYRDMKQFAFHSQIFFLTHKFRLHQDLEGQTGPVVLDRTIYEDAEIFATGLYETGKLSERDFALYRALYTNMCRTLRPPDLLIYLRCPIATLKKRIFIRGRKMELDIPTEYLKGLQKKYDEWIKRYDHGEVIVIESDQIDYTTDLIDRIDVMKRIEQFL